DHPDPMIKMRTVRSREHEFQKARDNGVFTESVVFTGWRGAGIWPCAGNEELNRGKQGTEILSVFFVCSCLAWTSTLIVANWVRAVSGKAVISACPALSRSKVLSAGLAAR